MHGLDTPSEDTMKARSFKKALRVGAAGLLVTSVGGIPAFAVANVDQDCTNRQSFVCSKGRLRDAEAVDTLLASSLSREGWAQPCVSVMYIAGDAGESDAISLTLHGAKGSGPGTCHGPTSGSASGQEIRNVGEVVKQALRSAPTALRHRLLRRVDLIQITNATGAEVQIETKEIGKGR